ncbi:MAG TPA: neutral zinc metallopeptidase, partial [Haliangium sp.]|nr:neutral zinc metallopeptidase [Haliangium sp.]
EDRRGMSAGGGRRIGAIGGGGAVVVLLLTVLLGGDAGSVLRALLGEGTSAPSTQPGPRSGPDPDREMVEFVSFVLDDVQNTWTTLFASGDEVTRGAPYRPAKLVLFTDRVDSACGFQSAATGPFYCPADQKAYIDLGFYRELAQRFGAPGDFAQAYVIAHELGHHVQNLLGYSERMHALARRDPDQQNALSVRLELQADCLAGVWAHHTAQRNVLERGDIEEGLTAAAAIGDDRLQRQATGTVQPESWTHGSSEQRMRWFQRGYRDGTIAGCDTFAIAEP